MTQNEQTFQLLKTYLKKKKTWTSFNLQMSLQLKERAPDWKRGPKQESCGRVYKTPSRR